MGIAQYVIENGGAGGALVIGIILIIFGVGKTAWRGTLSENAQRRNNERGRRDWPSRLL